MFSRLRRAGGPSAGARLPVSCATLGGRRALSDPKSRAYTYICIIHMLLATTVCMDESNVTVWTIGLTDDMLELYGLHDLRLEVEQWALDKDHHRC